MSIYLVHLMRRLSWEAPYPFKKQCKLVPALRSRTGSLASNNLKYIHHTLKVWGGPLIQVHESVGMCQASSVYLALNVQAPTSKRVERVY